MTENSKPAIKDGIQGKIVTKEVFEPNPIQRYEGKNAPKWLIWGLLITLVVGYMVIVRLFYKLLDIIQRDPTPLWPTIILLVVFAGTLWFGSIWIPKNDGKDHKLYYAWWLLIGTLLYSFYFHWYAWVGGFTIGVIQFLILRMLKGVLLMTRKVIKSDSAVLIVIFLTDFFIALTIYVLNIPTSWYVILGTISTFNASFWLMYRIWMCLPKQKNLKRNKF